MKEILKCLGIVLGVIILLFLFINAVAMALSTILNVVGPILFVVFVIALEASIVILGATAVVYVIRNG